MVRVILAFFVGTAAGFFGLYLIGSIIRMYAYEHIAPKEYSHLPPAKYAALVNERTSWTMIQVSLSGGVVCGLLSAVSAAGVFASDSGKQRRRPKAQASREMPLSRTEFERVLQSCTFVDLRDRPPAYLQGLLVGRLADSAPELAVKIDRFGEEHMAEVLQDVLVAAQTP